METKNKDELVQLICENILTNIKHKFSTYDANDADNISQRTNNWKSIADYYYQSYHIAMTGKCYGKSYDERTIQIAIKNLDELLPLILTAICNKYDLPFGYLYYIIVFYENYIEGQSASANAMNYAEEKTISMLGQKNGNMYVWGENYLEHFTKFIRHFKAYMKEYNGEHPLTIQRIKNAAKKYCQ